MIDEINEGRIIYDQICVMLGGKRTREEVHKMLKEREVPEAEWPTRAGQKFKAGTLSLDVEPDRSQRKVLTAECRKFYRELFVVKNIHCVYLGFRKRRNKLVKKVDNTG